RLCHPAVCGFVIPRFAALSSRGLRLCHPAVCGFVIPRFAALSSRGLTAGSN
ncbi:MAG: hypothetical protein HYW48_06475, partial [Deltaproteobacteria bacterium]|nr:hypothetical protein [Deltaproteobacteria bacterium]